MTVLENDFWIFVENENKTNKVEKSYGKWLLFFPWEEVWEQWKKIINAIDNYSLDAVSAKVSKKHNSNQNEKSMICIYTYENDIDLVRKQLFDLGFKKLLSFEKNSDDEIKIK